MCELERRDGLIRDVPVEQPFQGHFEVLKCSVCVDEDDEAVRVEERVENMRFHPSIVQTLHFVSVEESVVVAVDLCCKYISQLGDANKCSIRG